MDNRSFKEILQDFDGESDVFFTSPPLGAWVKKVQLRYPVRTSRWHHYIEDSIETPPTPPHINIDWSNDQQGALLFFNHYGTIKVSQDSSKEILKKAYHKLLFQFHPDQSETKSLEHFHELQKAYSILKG